MTTKVLFAALSCLEIALGSEESMQNVVANTSKAMIFDGENNPFTFRMFENFEVTREVLENEVKLVPQLKKLLENMKERRDVASNILKRIDIDYGPGERPHEHPINAFNVVKSLGIQAMDSLPKVCICDKSGV